MYPDYSRAERIADGIIHAIGITASLVAVALLLAFAFPSLSATSSTALVIYCLTVVTLFSVSAAYHMIPHAGAKRVLQRFDHAAIFFKIAGTYTPLVVLIGSAFGYVLLSIIWALAVAGATAKIAVWQFIDRYSVALFLALGWASVALIWPIVSTMPPIDSALIVIGGLLYTVGVIFHMWESLKYQNAIWHAFVLTASACHFAAVAHGSVSLA